MHQILNSTVYQQAIPPSFGGNPWLYMFALFGLIMVTLLACNWLWRVSWCLIEDKHHIKHPVTIARLVVALLLMTALLRGTPDAILLLRWPELSPHARFLVSATDRTLDGLAIFPFALAWLLDYVAGGYVQFKLKQLPPPPIEVIPRFTEVKRPVKIAAGSLAIAFAVVFLQ